MNQIEVIKEACDWYNDPCVLHTIDCEKDIFVNCFSGVVIIGICSSIIRFLLSPSDNGLKPLQLKRMICTEINLHAKNKLK
jgi:hypothetical protein